MTEVMHASSCAADLCSISTDCKAMEGGVPAEHIEPFSTFGSWAFLLCGTKGCVSRLQERKLCAEKCEIECTTRTTAAQGGMNSPISINGKGLATPLSISAAFKVASLSVGTLEGMHDVHSPSSVISFTRASRLTCCFFFTSCQASTSSFISLPACKQKCATSMHHNPVTRTGRTGLRSTGSVAAQMVHQSFGQPAMQDVATRM